MSLRRKLPISVCLLLLAGSLAATGVYAWRLHSAGYRAEMQRDLAEFLRLPSEIGAIHPLTFSSRAFDDVTVWLADRRARVFRCRRAIWHEERGRPDPPDHLDLYGGTLSIDAATWQRDDYQRVLESGLGHEPEALDLAEARLHDFSFDFVHRDVRLRCAQAGGVVRFEPNGDGVARIAALELNGVATDEPVHLTARFNPAARGLVRDLRLTVPDVPLAATGVNDLLRTRTTHGHFRGQIHYLAAEKPPAAIISGTLRELDLAELTAGRLAEPLSGSLDVSIESARVEERLLTELVGSGALRGLRLERLARYVGIDGLSGAAELRIGAIDARRGHVHRLDLDGIIRNVPLEPLSKRLGRGVVRGTLTLRLHALRIVDDRIAWADAEISAAPSPGEPAGTIDRELLLTGLSEILPVQLPPAVSRSLLPGRIEYARFGLRLQVEENKLRLLGTHGPRSDTILTLRILGGEFGVVKSLPVEIDLTPHVEQIRERIFGRDWRSDWRNLGDWGWRSGSSELRKPSDAPDPARP